MGPGFESLRAYQFTSSRFYLGLFLSLLQGFSPYGFVLLRMACALALAYCASDKFVVFAGFFAFQQSAAKQLLLLSEKCVHRTYFSLQAPARLPIYKLEVLSRAFFVLIAGLLTLRVRLTPYGSRFSACLLRSGQVCCICRLFCFSAISRQTITIAFGKMFPHIFILIFVFCVISFFTSIEQFCLKGLWLNNRFWDDYLCGYSLRYLWVLFAHYFMCFVNVVLYLPLCLWYIMVTI